MGLSHPNCMFRLASGPAHGDQCRPPIGGIYSPALKVEKVIAGNSQGIVLSLR